MYIPQNQYNLFPVINIQWWRDKHATFKKLSTGFKTSENLKSLHPFNSYLIKPTKSQQIY
jgi:hypothetical protein